MGRGGERVVPSQQRDEVKILRMMMKEVSGDSIYRPRGNPLPGKKEKREERSPMKTLK